MRLRFVFSLLLLTAVCGLAQSTPTPTRHTGLKKLKPAPYSDPRPKMAGSSTGYIDNAIVGNEVRVRFDSDFNLQNPDRAEFFYAKCGCYRTLANTNPNFDPNAPGPGTVAATKVNLQELQLHVEYAPISRFSIIAEVPGRWIQFTPNTIPNGTGLGDFRAGFKVAAIATDTQALTFQFRTYFPTGDSRAGLGTNHYSVEPTMLYYQRLNRRLAISGQFGDWHPLGGSAGVPTNSTSGFAGDILNYGGGAAYDVYIRENLRITPVVEFVGWHILSGYATGPANASASGTNIVNAKLGARFSFGKHSSIYAGYGHALTNTTWYANMLRVEYRFAL